MSMMKDDDRVRVERVWKDTVQKERDLRADAQKSNGPPSYVMNLANLQTKGGPINIKHAHSRLEIISEKVEKRTPAERDSAEGYDLNGFEANVMNHLHKYPAQKFDVPCTRAQEIGWLISNPTTMKGFQQRARTKKYLPPPGSLREETEQRTLQLSRSAPSISMHLPTSKPLDMTQINNRRFYRPKTFCPITKYADTYMSLMHENPFALR